MGVKRLPLPLPSCFNFFFLAIWRRKEETDISRGTDKLSRIVSSRMSDAEFEQISKSKAVRITSREEAYYYKMMR
ncbi:MAG: hypothetical protein KAV25_03080 [Methanophagales archaeon]|nr:hypothetical protein [Methanophagales archaeon]